jgi:hypothetical protein
MKDGDVDEKQRQFVEKGLAEMRDADRRDRELAREKRREKRLKRKLLERQVSRWVGNVYIVLIISFRCEVNRSK